MNKDKQFIKDCYDEKYGSMCSDWKAIIENHYPEFKEEKFRVGDWVIGWWSKQVTRLESKNKFGFSTSWIKHGYNQNLDIEYIQRKATKEEIESHLIEEAKRRGFKEGVVVKSVQYPTSTYNGGVMTCKSPQYVISQDRLYKGGICIYQKGQWAEIIPTMTKEEAEEKLNCKIV